MRNLALIILCSLLTALSASAQSERTATLYRTDQRGLRFDVRAGYTLGGTSPLPLPAEIRSIDAFRPGQHFMIQGDVSKQLNRRWGVSVGLRLENKGMDTKAQTKNYGMDMWQEGNRMVGFFTGTVETKVSCAYLTVPVLATLYVSPRWQLRMGPYFSLATHREFSGTVYDGYLREDTGKSLGLPSTGPTGQKVVITSENPATYDFSDDLRRFQWGLEAGADWRALTHLNVFAHLDWGLNGAFQRDFETITFTMFPIYATLGFAYAF